MDKGKPHGEHRDTSISLVTTYLTQLPWRPKMGSSYQPGVAQDRCRRPSVGLLRAVLGGLSGAKRKVAVFFNAYFDDSGTHPRSKVIAVGGCIGTLESWEGLSEKWQERLDEWSLPYFRMADWEALQGNYETWSKPVAERRLRELLKIIYDHGILTFGFAVARKEFNEVLEMFPDAKRRSGGVYGYLGQECVKLVRDSWRDFFTEKGNAGDLARVSYFFEDGTKGYGEIEKAWRRERETLRWQDVLIARVPKELFPPVQVADIVAYELRELFPMAAGWVPRGEHRYPSQQLRRRYSEWRYMTGNGGIVGLTHPERSGHNVVHAADPSLRQRPEPFDGVQGHEA